MVNSEQLKQMKSMDLSFCNQNELIDIKTIDIDNSLDKISRISKYIEDIKNPYLFKAGDTLVHVQYEKDGASLQESIINILTI